MSLSLQIHKLRSNLKYAEEDWAALALKVSNAPGDRQLNEEVTQLEAIIEQYKKGIKRCEAAAAEQAKRDTQESKHERFAAITEQRKRLAESNAKMEALATDLQKTLADLGALMEKLDKGIAERTELARIILRETRFEAADDRRAENLAYPMRLSTGEVINAMANAVAKCGIGHRAINLQPYVQVTPPNQVGQQWELSAAVAKATGELTSALDGRIASAKTHLIGDE